MLGQDYQSVGEQAFLKRKSFLALSGVADHSDEAVASVAVLKQLEGDRALVQAARVELLVGLLQLDDLGQPWIGLQPGHSIQAHPQQLLVCVHSHDVGDRVDVLLNDGLVARLRVP